jgi:hypothetical protein
VQGSPTEAELRRLSEEGDGWARVLQGLIDDGEGRLAGYSADPARELAEIAAELRRVDSLRRELAEVRTLLAQLEERSRDLRSHWLVGQR